MAAVLTKIWKPVDPWSHEGRHLLELRAAVSDAQERWSAGAICQGIAGQLHLVVGLVASALKFANGVYFKRNRLNAA